MVEASFSEITENVRQRASNNTNKCSEFWMIHYFTAPATAEVVEYLRFGNREFYTRLEGPDKHLTVNFLATDEYVAKMRKRPFLKNIEIKIKA